MNKAKLEKKICNSAKKNNGDRPLDERQQRSNSTVLLGALLFGMAFDLIMVIYCFVTKNIEKTYPYVAQLVVMGVGCFLFSLRNQEVHSPKVFFGRRSANTDQTVSAFFSRLAWCILDSLVFAVAITAFDAYTEAKLTGSLVSDGIIAFCVFTVMESVFCEIRVRRYRRFVAMLDAEENDLDD